MTVLGHLVKAIILPLDGVHSSLPIADRLSDLIILHQEKSLLDLHSHKQTGYLISEHRTIPDIQSIQTCEVIDLNKHKSSIVQIPNLYRKCMSCARTPFFSNPINADCISSFKYNLCYLLMNNESDNQKCQ